MENKRTERIMNSLDGLQKAAAPDFFYTRLMGRLQQETVTESSKFFLLRPAFVAAALAVVFVINIISLVKFDRQPVSKGVNQSKGPATIESFTTAYGMNTETVYE